MSATRTRIVAIALLAVLGLPLLAACGSPAPKPAGQATKAAPASAGQPTAAQAVPTASQPSGAANPQSRVAKALGLLSGSNSQPSVFPSYHLEVKGSSPTLDSESREIVAHISDLRADVQGENVHLFDLNDEGEMAEGYIIKEGGEIKGYGVKDGVLKEGTILSVRWVGWPMRVMLPLALAAVGIQPAGSETIDGRQAEVYAVDAASGETEAVKAARNMLGKGYSNIRGTMWVDQETGGLLKAVVDYEQDVYDLTSTDKNVPPAGHGSGHCEIAVSQVGNVSVSLPQ